MVSLKKKQGVVVQGHSADLAEKMGLQKLFIGTNNLW